MAKLKEEGQRRVYVLPAELVERVVNYQRQRGLSSEVDAVRRLLDEALKIKETDEDILLRLEKKIINTNDLYSAAKEVLAGHPIVSQINFDDDYIEFKLKGFGIYRVDGLSNIEILNDKSQKWEKWRATE